MYFPAAHWYDYSSQNAGTFYVVKWLRQKCYATVVQIWLFTCEKTRLMPRLRHTNLQLKLLFFFYCTYPCNKNLSLVKAAISWPSTHSELKLPPHHLTVSWFPPSLHWIIFFYNFFWASCSVVIQDNIHISISIYIYFTEVAMEYKNYCQFSIFSSHFPGKGYLKSWWHLCCWRIILQNYNLLSKFFWTGAGVILCIEKALAQSGVSREDVNYINAHATSTPAGDLKEYQALSHCFGQNIEVLISFSFHAVAFVSIYVPSVLSLPLLDKVVLSCS